MILFHLLTVVIAFCCWARVVGSIPGSSNHMVTRARSKKERKKTQGRRLECRALGAREKNIQLFRMNLEPNDVYYSLRVALGCHTKWKSDYGINLFNLTESAVLLPGKPLWRQDLLSGRRRQPKYFYTRITQVARREERHDASMIPKAPHG